MKPIPAGLVLLLGSIAALAPLAVDMYLPALPALAQSLQASPAAVQWSLAVYFIGLACGQMLYGPLADRLGRKPPLYFGLTLFTVAALACATAASIEALIAWRLAQALGGCACMVVVRAVVRDHFDPQTTARVFSLLMLVMGVAPILAPLAGGYLLLWFGWRSIFLFQTLFGLACLVAVALTLAESHPPAARSPTHGLLGRALVEYRALLGDRRFMGYCLAGGAAQAGMFAYIVGSPFVIIELFGVPAEHFGWVFGANAFGLIAASQINARLLHRVGYARMLALAMRSVAVFGAVLVIVGATGFGGLPGLLIPLFGFLTTLGFSFPNASAGALADQGHRAGSASALLGTLQFGAATLAAASVGALGATSALPMTAVMAGCGLVALAVHTVLIARPDRHLATVER